MHHPYCIKKGTLTPALRDHIYKSFSQYAIASTGMDGLSEEAVSFEMRDGKKLVGCVVVHLFWGHLHIKYLLVEEPYRGQGYATALMERAFHYAQEQGCRSVFVESLSFQAPQFYQKLGFKIDFVREGGVKGTRFYYLSKELGKKESAEVTLKKLEKEDIPNLVEDLENGNWPKSISLFEKYLNEQQHQERHVWLASWGGQFVGYITLKWQSSYLPFSHEGIPEIMDLNVLPAFRNKGIGSKLLDVAEALAALQNPVVGIGVGLYEGYGEAQKLYINRGYIPDGKGVTYRYHTIAAGETVPLDDDFIFWMTKAV